MSAEDVSLGSGRADEREAALRRIVADRGDARARLDHVLARHLAEVAEGSRTQIQQWIEAGRVSIDGRRAVKPAMRVAAGQTLTVVVPQPSVRPRPVHRVTPVDVLFEDEHVIAVDKRAGLVSHPTYKNAAGTVLDALRAHVGSGEVPRLVQRLDKHTSGVMLAAKTVAAQHALVRALAARTAVKQYLGIVHGKVSAPRVRIDLPLARDLLDRRRVVVSQARGRTAVTICTRLAVSRGARVGLSLVACRLLTGRTHQIRVHLAARGWPLVGDATYGVRLHRGASPVSRRHLPADPVLAAACRSFPRQALHAWRLEFDHPFTAQRLCVMAPVPNDLLELLTVAGVHSRYMAEVEAAHASA